MQILTPRLVLREFSPADWAKVHEYAQLLEVVKYEPWGPNTEEDTRDFIRRAVAGQADLPRLAYEFAVTLRSTGELIGGTGIRIRDELNREGDIGYTLRKETWGQGLGTELARGLVQFGFETLELHRIWATCHVENQASARVLEKAGLQKEGLLRKNRLQREGYRDSCLYAILEDDPRPSF